MSEYEDTYASDAEPAPSPEPDEDMPAPMAEPGIYIWTQEATQHPVLGVLAPDLEYDFTTGASAEALRAIQSYLDCGYMEKVS